VGGGHRSGIPSQDTFRIRRGGSSRAISKKHDSGVCWRDSCHRLAVIEAVFLLVVFKAPRMNSVGGGPCETVVGGLWGFRLQVVRVLLGLGHA